MSDLAAQLALIAQIAPRLRAAGVSSLAVGDVSMELLPPEPPVLTDIKPEEVEAPRGVLEDHDSYGLPDGATLPGFRRPDDLPRKG